MDRLLSRYLEYAESKALVCGLPNRKSGYMELRNTVRHTGFRVCTYKPEPNNDELGEFYD
jgi:hypothetical protein